jgi:uncharacterized protein YjbI with pentapeptide repeats
MNEDRCPAALDTPRYGMIIRLTLLALLTLAICPSSYAAPVTIRQIVEALAKATPDHPADFTGFDMTELDLSGIDFKGAKLVDANMFGVDLTGADLSHANLTRANLNRVTIIHANFSHADLTETTMFLPAAFSTLQPIPSEAPNFEGAIFRKAHILAKLCWSNMIGADFTGAEFDGGRNRLHGPARTDLTGARLMHANLPNAKLARMVLEMADLSQANLAGADLNHSVLESTKFNGAKLDNVDFSNADLADADMTGASMKGINLTGAEGLDKAKGLK